MANGCDANVMQNCDVGAIGGPKLQRWEHGALTKQVNRPAAGEACGAEHTCPAGPVERRVRPRCVNLPMMRAEGHATNDSATEGTTQLLRWPMPGRSDAAEERHEQRRRNRLKLRTSRWRGPKPTRRQ